MLIFLNKIKILRAENLNCICNAEYIYAATISLLDTKRQSAGRINVMV